VIPSYNNDIHTVTVVDELTSSIALISSRSLSIIVMNSYKQKQDKYDYEFLHRSYLNHTAWMPLS